MPNSVILPSFAAGELSPGLAARVDLAKYHVGAALLENFFIDYKGGAASRPGTQHIGPASTVAGNSAWLYKFTFSATQQYVLVFSEYHLRFIRNPGTVPNHPNGSNAGFIQLAGVDYDIATPWPSVVLPDLKFAQAGDLLQITHPNYPRMVLQRHAETNWGLNPPTIGATIISPANVLATISALPSGSTDPGNTTYLYTVTAVDKTGEESALSGPGSALGYFSLVTGVDMAITPATVTVTWNDVPAAAYYNVYKTIPGYADKVPPYSSSFGFCGIAYGNQFTDSNIVPDFTKAPPLHTDPFSPGRLDRVTVTSSSNDWPVGTTEITITDATGTGAIALAVLDTSARGGHGHIVDIFVVAAGAGYTAPTITASGGGSSFAATATLTGPVEDPTSVAYHQQRLIVAGTTSYPTGIFGSKTGFYNNFDKSNPVLDDDSFTFILAASEINAILHMIPMPGGLVLFTDSGIQQLTGGSSTATNPSAITPSSVVAVPQSYFGASRVRPLVINREILFVQSSGAAVQDLAYNFIGNIYEGADITVLSSHLFYPHTIRQWDYSHTPHKIIWAVRDDGVLLSLTWLKEQEVAAWTHHLTNGWFEGVTVIREGNTDAVYFVVNRNAVRYVERLAGRVLGSVADAWCLDAALSYSGAPTTVLSGLGHLEGYSVAVLGDGVVQGRFTVTGGSITLPTAVSAAVAGLPFDARMQTLQLDLGQEGATVQGKRKRIAAASIRVRETAATGVKVGTTFDTLVPFVPNISSTDNMSLAGLVTGDMRLIIDPSFNVHGQICVEQQDPLPVTVLGIIPEVVVGDNGGRGR